MSDAVSAAAAVAQAPAQQQAEGGAAPAANISNNDTNEANKDSPSKTKRRGRRGGKARRDKSANRDEHGSGSDAEPAGNTTTTEVAAAEGDHQQQPDVAGTPSKTATTTTESENPRARPPRCKQCNVADLDLFRDSTDGKLYCAKCWKAFYKKHPPSASKFKAGNTGGKPAAGGSNGRSESREEVGEPIAGNFAEVDQFYEAGIREGAPSVFVDKHKVAWSVMLKGAANKLAYAMLQLILHTDCCVVYTRTGLITEGSDHAKETYSEHTELPDAKAAFEHHFREFTGNEFEDVKRCVTKFVTRKEYTLLADVKAARRAENDNNRKAREAMQSKIVEQRNADLVAQVKAELAAELNPLAKEFDPAHRSRDATPQKGSNGSASTNGNKKQQQQQQNAAGVVNAPAIRTEDRRKSPQPQALNHTDVGAARQPPTAAHQGNSGELSPAEPPCTPAVGPNPNPTRGAPSPAVKPAQAPPPPPTGATRPSAPGGVKPAQPTQNLAPAPASAGYPTPQPQPQPGPRNVSDLSPSNVDVPKKGGFLDPEDERPTGGMSTTTLAAIAVAGAAVAGIAFVMLSKKQK